MQVLLKVRAVQARPPPWCRYVPRALARCLTAYALLTSVPYVALCVVRCAMLLLSVSRALPTYLPNPALPLAALHPLRCVGFVGMTGLWYHERCARGSQLLAGSMNRVAPLRCVGCAGTTGIRFCQIPSLPCWLVRSESSVYTTLAPLRRTGDRPVASFRLPATNARYGCRCK